MTVRIAINGFGRIGRSTLLALRESERDDLKVVAINDISSTDNLVHLLKYDSLHGGFNGIVSHMDSTINIGTGDIQVSAIREQEKLNWDRYDVDIVMECTGHFTDRVSAEKHLSAGAKRVLISAPGKGADRTIVYGVNDGALTKNDHIVSNASCTTNALAPLAKVLNENFGVENGFMTTVHCYNGNQPILDRPHENDYNRGRAAALSMIPTTTGAMKAFGKVMPELKGKLAGRAIRVPTPNVSVIDFVVNTKKFATADTVNAAMRDNAEGSLKHVLQVVDDMTVSIDFNHDSHSTTLMTGETIVTNGHLIRVLSWYDNEWGFSNRMLDTAAVMAKFL